MFAAANLQLWLMEHPEVVNNDLAKATEMVMAAIRLGQNGNCVADVAEQVLGPELGQTFLAETVMDVLHMKIWIAQCTSPWLLLFGVEPSEDEQKGESGGTNTG